LPLQQRLQFAYHAQNKHPTDYCRCSSACNLLTTHRTNTPLIIAVAAAPAICLPRTEQAPHCFLPLQQRLQFAYHAQNKHPTDYCRCSSACNLLTTHRTNTPLILAVAAAPAICLPRTEQTPH